MGAMAEQSCENCKYFTQFYCKTLTHIKRVGWGSCFFPKRVKIIDLKYNALGERCENWEQAEPVQDRRLKTIDSVIRETEEHLREIEMILKSPH